MKTVSRIRSTAKCPHCPALLPVWSEEKEHEYLKHIDECRPTMILFDKRVENFTRLAEEINDHPAYRTGLVVCTRCFDFRRLSGNIAGLACKCGGIMLREDQVITDIDGVPVPIGFF